MPTNIKSNSMEIFKEYQSEYRKMNEEFKNMTSKIRNSLLIEREKIGDSIKAQTILIERLKEELYKVEQLKNNLESNKDILEKTPHGFKGTERYEQWESEKKQNEEILAIKTQELKNKNEELEEYKSKLQELQGCYKEYDEILKHNFEDFQTLLKGNEISINSKSDSMEKLKEYQSEYRKMDETFKNMSNKIRNGLLIEREKIEDSIKAQTILIEKLKEELDKVEQFKNNPESNKAILEKTPHGFKGTEEYEKWEAEKKQNEDSLAKKTQELKNKNKELEEYKSNLKELQDSYKEYDEILKHTFEDFQKLLRGDEIAKEGKRTEAINSALVMADEVKTQDVKPEQPKIQESETIELEQPKETELGQQKQEEVTLEQEDLKHEEEIEVDNEEIKSNQEKISKLIKEISELEEKLKSDELYILDKWDIEDAIEMKKDTLQQLTSGQGKQKSNQQSSVAKKLKIETEDSKVADLEGTNPAPVMEDKAETNEIHFSWENTWNYISGKSAKNQEKSIKEIQVSINNEGYVVYAITYNNGEIDRTSEVTELNRKEYKKELKRISKEYLFYDKKDLKKIDPYLMKILEKNDKRLATDYPERINRNFAKLDEDYDYAEVRNYDVVYDMENLKNLNMSDRALMRKIARGARKSGIEVQNFKDTPIREFFGKLKNKFVNAFAVKEEVKSLGDGDTKAYSYNQHKGESQISQFTKSANGYNHVKFSDFKDRIEVSKECKEKVANTAQESKGEKSQEPAIKDSERE